MGLVGYGVALTDLSHLDRRRDQLGRHGARVAAESVVLDADRFRSSRDPSPFERIALEALLDSLTHSGLSEGTSAGPCVE